MAEKDLEKTNLTLALALAAGDSVEDAAKRAGIARTTAYRRLENSDFQRLVSQLRTGLADQALGKLSELMATAVETLEELVKPGVSPSVRLSAARTVLEFHLKLTEACDLARQVAELQEIARRLNGGERS